MNQLTDPATWPGRAHFEFFFGLRRTLFRPGGRSGLPPAQAEARRLGVSFLCCYLGPALPAAHRAEAFRYRIGPGPAGYYDRRPAGRARAPRPG